jgi:internalin A
MLLNLRSLETQAIAKPLSPLQLMTQPELLDIIHQAARTKRKTLDLSGKGLTELPLELWQLTHLIKLDLSDNQLKGIPTEVSQLSDLQGLSLSKNRLTTLPAEVWGHLSNLVWLDLRFNRLTDLPAELGQLANLTQLYVDGNRLTELPAELGQLANLKTLDFRNNRLSQLPESLGQLINLKRLYLDNNRLNQLPESLGRLSSLISLYLDYNQLNQLPPELGQMSNLTSLSLDQNPLTFPPPEIVEQGTVAMLKYLREQLTGSQQWASKLIVVGEGGVGKTSLLRALQGETFDDHQSTTRGIALGQLRLPHPTRADITMQLNTWDFGGQEIYHATHQFFLTNRSLFLLAWNARLGWEQGKLVYWLKTIRSNAPDSPILLITTHRDERDADLPLSDLQQQFPQIIGQWEISNLDGTGIEPLRQAITHAAAELPLMGERWPTTWLNFANALRNSNQRYTTAQKFWGVMTHYKVAPDSQNVLATWLHELGEILFFQDNEELNDIVIFKPQWVTEHISRVLEAEEVIRRNGIFTRTCMEQLWSDLDASMRNHFLRLMERFDLSYRTQENKDISLVVERLPFEPPDYEPMWEAKQQEPNCKQITMKFQLSEVLPGLPTWFIARQHRFTIDQGERRGIHWRTGVLFQDLEHKHLALTRTSRDDRTNSEYLQLTVRGTMPHSFFDLLKEGIELTLRRYPGLQITRLIPCPDPNREACLHEFDYANLVKRLERTPPKESIECPSCLETISVTQLLFGLHWTTQNAVLQRINELEDSLEDSMQVGFNELRELIQSNFLRQFRQQQKFAESHCPNVFVLRPDDRKIWAKDLGMQRINLQLYCQMPGCLHPTIDPTDPRKPCGLYVIDQPQQWLQVIIPYYRHLVGVLKFAAPLIGLWLGNMDVQAYEATFRNDIALAKELINRLPMLKGGDLDHPETILGADYPSEETASPHRMESLDGAALRALRHLLEQKDPSQQWGNLKKTLTPEGDYLWLCDHHARLFKP